MADEKKPDLGGNVIGIRTYKRKKTPKDMEEIEVPMSKGREVMERAITDESVSPEVKKFLEKRLEPNPKRRGYGKAPKKLGGGGGKRNEYNLTVKQEAFAQEVAKGRTLSDALRTAYNTEGWSPKTIWGEASNLGSHPFIVARIRQLNAEKEAREVDRAETLKTFVIERLQKEAMEAKQDGARVRALELLGKLTEVAAFTELSEVVQRQDRSPQEIEADITALLDRLDRSA